MFISRVYQAAFASVEYGSRHLDVFFATAPFQFVQNCPHSADFRFGCAFEREKRVSVKFGNDLACLDPVAFLDGDLAYLSADSESQVDFSGFNVATHEDT